MADERHKIPNAADEEQLRRGSAYIQETFGVSPFELYARHSPDRDRVAWVLAGELRSRCLSESSVCVFAGQA
ncbi:hypothetical protein LO772_29755 [Yinghuangia sp. ASG 101]|uniref:hypothetical protein n=1 Tax=Yinghuangia sp. ASG 101 TaxID=2896848 RepID=UPI001E2FE027|nr:hypothetical protein [Yinghuangia sp. ASG 101]UGQ10953.1 hypothetical protein LO772_29755 [Yinghuangia sp. ASG 101]